MAEHRIATRRCAADVLAPVDVHLVADLPRPGAIDDSASLRPMARPSALPGDRGAGQKVGTGPTSNAAHRHRRRAARAVGLRGIQRLCLSIALIVRRSSRLLQEWLSGAERESMRVRLDGWSAAERGGVELAHRSRRSAGLRDCAYFDLSQVARREASSRSSCWGEARGRTCGDCFASTARLKRPGPSRSRKRTTS